MTSLNLKEIGDNISKLRKEKDLSPTELSEQIYSSGRSAVNNWEKGHNCPSNASLEQLGNVFGVEPIKIIFANNTQLKKFISKIIEGKLDSIYQSKLKGQGIEAKQVSFWKLLLDYYSTRSLPFICLYATYQANLKIVLSVMNNTTFKLIWLNEEKQKKITQHIQKKGETILKILFDWIKQNITDDLNQPFFDQVAEAIYSQLKGNFQISMLKENVPFVFFKLEKNNEYTISNSDIETTSPFQYTKLFGQLIQSIYISRWNAWNISENLDGKKKIIINKSIINILKSEKKFAFELVDKIIDVDAETAVLGQNELSRYTDFKINKNFLPIYFERFISSKNFL